MILRSMNADLVCEVMDLTYVLIGLLMRSLTKVALGAKKSNLPIK